MADATRPNHPPQLLSRRLLGVGAAVLILLNVLLLFQNRELRKKREFSIVASRVSEISGINVRTGQYQTIPFDSARRFLILTFSGGCPSCRASLDEWRAISTSLDPARWSVIIVSRDSPSFTASFSDIGIDGMMLADVPHRLYAQLGLAAVPKAILLSHDGNVLGSVRGEMNSAQAATLKRLLEEAER